MESESSVQNQLPDSSTNQELFAVSAAIILDQLYDSFPCQRRIQRQEIIERVFDLEALHQAHRLANFESSKREMFQNPKTREILLDSGEMDAETLAEQDRKLSNQGGKTQGELDAEKQVSRLSGEKDRIEQVFDGTLDFLCEEGFVRNVDNEFCLSARGLESLGFQFKNQEITKSGKSPIEIIKGGLKKGATTAAGEGFRACLSVFVNLAQAAL